MRMSLWASALLPVACATATSPSIGIAVNDLTDANVANVHLRYPDTALGKHVSTYGDCNSKTATHASSTVARVSSSAAAGDHMRLVWVIPDDALLNGCISAWDDKDSLIGRSEPLELDGIQRISLAKRDRIAMTNESGIDTEGPWFNGVELLKNREIDLVDVKKAKSKSIGIIGAGMSGLMTYLLLHSVGFTNIEISESTGRVGGRVWTEYFDPNPCNYQYQEIGAMRIPITATFPLGNQSLTRNFTNHEIVFHLTEELNRLNKHDETWAIDWIPFLQNSDNALSLLGDKRNPDGSIPTAGDVAKNPALGAETLYTDALDALREKVNEVEFNPEMMELIAKNIYEAHKKFLDVGLNERGGDQWTQTGYVHNELGYDLNTTDLAGLLTLLEASVRRLAEVM